VIGLLLDTHALLWFVFRDPRLSPAAYEVTRRSAESGNRLGLSVLSLIEIVYLVEKQRLPPTTLAEVMDEVARQPTLFEVVSVSQEVALAMERVSRDEVPDMPDRIIAATALHLDVPLVSRDRKIRLSQVQTVW